MKHGLSIYLIGPSLDLLQKRNSCTTNFLKKKEQQV